MIKDNKQIGEPFVDFKDTWTNIQALANPVEGMIAWDTTNHRGVEYDGNNWKEIGSSTSGHVIQYSGTSQTNRSNLNFTGSVLILDDSSNDATVINVGNSETGGNSPASKVIISRSFR